MLRRMGRYKRWLLLVLAVVTLLIAFAPMIKRTVKSGPLRAAYLNYSKWRYNWRSPSDLGDGKNALEVIIESPMGIAGDSAGVLYVSDREGFVWKIDLSGKATVVAGTGMTTGPGGLPAVRTFAREVDLASPEGLAIDGEGNILFADSANHSILKIDRDGYLIRFAGNGSSGYNGDGKLATESSLATPHDVRIDSKGNVFIADVFNHRIRKVDRKGIITTVAGTGEPGYSGDGGLALHAKLNNPYGIFLDRDDNLLIADSENNVIRRLTNDGIIKTIAGSGQRGFAGDGGPALKAKLDSPQSLAIDAEGRIYIGDEHNNAIRMVEADGTMRTIIGTQGPGFSGDGGPAAMAQIADPENMWIRKDGGILIAARDNSRLRLITSDRVIKTFAGKGPTSRHEYFAPIYLPPVEP